MNTSHIKSYAPKARTAFIDAMTKRAALFGIRESSIPAMGIAPLEQKGDLALIGDRAFPASIIRPRAALVKKVEQLGFAQAMEQAAYSWFNRLCAIRYMELKDYLDHGRRVLSAADGSAGTPQILEDCLEVELPGLDKQLITELKLDGNKDEELYRELLLAQCHALHQAMPFLFEAVDDATELLLPDNLTKTDSLIRELVSAIPEEDWANIEIIGWLYQFYISEKKDQVIGKVVKSEDIPAATQLFTPNWIVKYMVQNSLGAQWLATYPDSPLKAQMDYFIEPAEQTDEVKAQLAAITPESLNPEELTLIDPASGSGHILVEAYDLFKAIYLERGYRQRDVAQLILEKNLFGLDIDERAAQLSGFALMMKGRADDRRLFERGVKLNVMALIDSAGFDPEVLANGVKLADFGLQLGDLTELKRLFEHATTFGSLIQVPERLAKKLPGLKQLSEVASQDLFVADELKSLGPLVQQAELLAAQYDAVVANPPYMGSKFCCPALKDLVNTAFKAGKADLYGAFMLRNILLARANGHVGMITIPNWMFTSSFEDLRDVVFRDAPISSLVHNGRGVWGSDFGSCSYVLKRSSPHGLVGQFLRLFDKQGSVAANEELERRFRENPRFSTSNTEFQKIPGSPAAYWASKAVIDCFEDARLLSMSAKVCEGMNTANNDLFVRQWQETSLSTIGFDGGSKDADSSGLKKWFPYEKGGDYRKWFGNLSHIVNWENSGCAIKAVKTATGATRANIRNEDCFFSPAITWTYISSSFFGVRERGPGAIFDGKGPSLFSSENERPHQLAMLCSKPATMFMRFLNPTLNFSVGSVSNLPLPREWPPQTKNIAEECRQVAQADWNAYERSWEFQSLPMLTASSKPALTLESSYTDWINHNRATIAEMQRLEEENNRLIEFISVAWDKTHLEANLRFLADNLSPKKTESSRDTLRRYLCDNFFKDHLQTYKKRPIYWLFSSGKQKAFQCLVYLHRYNEGTLARMRTEYVIPLSAKLSSYAAKLEKDIEASNSTAEKKALEKQLSTLHNQQAELATFDEKLRHHADQRISLDLDDGVKVNYGKFGDLLAEVKAVTGDKAE